MPNYDVKTEPTGDSRTVQLLSSISNKLNDLENKVKELRKEDEALVKDLTVSELKDIVRNIIREEIRVIDMYPKSNPLYVVPQLPEWDSNRVWCTDTLADRNVIGDVK